MFLPDANFQPRSTHSSPLVRRVSFDFTCLTHTPAEQEPFLSHHSYAKLVDRLLANEQYDVRWGRHWLDVLRYADLDGLDREVMPTAPGASYLRRRH
jgi:hypothetical protein